MTSIARPPPLLLVIYRSNGNSYTEYLLDTGFRVAEAHTTDGGIEQAIALVPDLIVLDFDLDGELVARLRGHETTKAIPIIALTELTHLRDRGHTLPRGGAC